MGLDWCVLDKTKNGMGPSKAFADAQLKKIDEKLDAEWRDYAKENADPEGLSLSVFPNPVHDAFLKTSAYKELSEEMKRWREVRSQSVVTPMETLGAPRVGSDPEADEYLRNLFAESDEVKQEYSTFDEFLEANRGLYVAKLCKNKGGLGVITGIFAGEESFRGKVIGNMDWLPQDLRGRAYDDQSPEELVSYGEELSEAADEFESVSKRRYYSVELPREVIEDLATVRSAASWCDFWGKAGHGMHAWY